MTGTTIKILLILTSQTTMGDDPRPTGVWFEEMSTPYYAFVDAGAQVDIASIAGGKIPVDPHSIEVEGKNPPSVERFLKDKAAMAKLEGSLKIDNVTPEGYSAVFLPGGHGTMWDLPQSTKLADLLSSAWADGKVVAAVCHGPAGLVNVKDVNGQPLVAGRRISAFTNSEEDAAGLTDKVPFLLETRIRGLGANYQSGPDFQPFAVRDGKLVTGQNPASSERVAELVLEAIKDAR
ncbi:type 1 glutamine amidotransferase domain-containing protein [Pseudomonas aeruginosa]|uniref:type 1 glutamine amidotransferase domain-containing protein n=1 Tax=Pseudomonas aeruginosa TaxID=287 RepID=UPI00053D6AC2|nr:type 1 glutamine amidotransferase domain-containing protein [Pseudomonas aeruginosa]MCO2030135.1 type 1 glutamine amidotransferase domain-containing protein [Pseudomonas aeruginosa]MCS7675713.1 type 1 glutamine amidotransferase domain-containing protein [Pseudomonas aeruginosa]MCS7905020.1 type 1 glutamine amidotransferase domain-containing protein [Pseudomonas aeruginosa]MCS9345783.1 type 1 glutamine amidotransferase domain-containing protein [Pseudomonas aeruginosa]MCS9358622.1 type 1 glu